MIATRLLASAAIVFAVSGCFEGRGLEVRTISLDHLTGAQAEELAVPYLSKEGKVFRSSESLSAITVRDHSRNVDRIRSMLSARDASPGNVSLHFQLIRATDAGGVEAGLERIAGALGELLRYQGYELLSEAVVSAAERGTIEQTLDGGDVPLQLGVRVADVRGYEGNGSVEMEVNLWRPQNRMLATNVVVPIGETVVLGTAYPGVTGSALILTVRGEMGSQKLRATSRSRRSSRADVEITVEGDRAAEAHGIRLPAGAAVGAGPTVTPRATPGRDAQRVTGVRGKTPVPAKTVVVPPPAPDA